MYLDSLKKEIEDHGHNRHWQGEIQILSCQKFLIAFNVVYLHAINP
jgi:hypothetical protein